MFRKILICAALVAGCATASADVILDEGFNDISTLGVAGWLTVNNSTPGGGDPWFQGNTGVFDAASGPANSYIASNFLAAGAGGNVDAWLISPLLNVYGVTDFSFSTRTEGALPGDTLSVYGSLGGSALSDFALLGTLSGAGFPLDWTAFGASGTFAPGSTLRLAFRYQVTDTNVNGDYIGIDSVKVNSVPEPATLSLIMAALLMLAMRRRSRQS
jgi:hypothetical protein